MRDCLLGQYEKSMPHAMSLREKLALSRRCGFDYLEISVDETDEKLSRLDWGRERRALRRAVEDGPAHPFHVPFRTPEIPVGQQRPGACRPEPCNLGKGRAVLCGSRGAADPARRL